LEAEAERLDEQFAEGNLERGEEGRAFEMESSSHGGRMDEPHPS
jgi:hypothetical protein